MSENSKRILYLGLDPSHTETNGEFVHLPIIQIVPRALTDAEVQHALQQFANYTHVIVTSKTTVSILNGYLPSANAWNEKIILAVGRVTAKHLEACGITPTIIASEETAEGLIHEMEQLDLTKAYLFWPHSAKARPVIKDYLEANHIAHTSCILYEPKTQIPKELPELANFDEIIFTSPSTVDAFFEIFGYFPTHCALTPIGPITKHHLNHAIN